MAHLQQERLELEKRRLQDKVTYEQERNAALAQQNAALARQEAAAVERKEALETELKEMTDDLFATREELERVRARLAGELLGCVLAAAISSWVWPDCEGATSLHPAPACPAHCVGLHAG